jgi:DNA ligase-4
MNILDKEREDVAFDILYSGDSSVIHRPLRERQHLLQKAIRPLKGRLELLLPESGGLNAHRPSGEPLWSILASSAEEAQKFFQETVDNRCNFLSIPIVIHSSEEFTIDS